MGRMIPGEGPVPCSVMFIGERPGREEDRRGRPFVGPAGREFDRYLLSVGLARDKVYVTNLVKDFAGEGVEPTAEEIERDGAALMKELEQMRPRFIGLLGRYASRRFLGDVDLEWAHGLPFPPPQPDCPVECFVPIYHPAAGIHSTEMQAFIQYDFQQLRLVMDGKIEPRTLGDEYPNPDYNEGVINRLYPNRPLAVDTEGTVQHPWGMSLTQEPGQAKVLRAASVKRWVNGGMNWKPARIVLRNALHDLAVLRAMGIHLRPGQYTDNTIKSYLLQVEPQDLKQSARRHCGMVMQRYDELIASADRRIALEYLYMVGSWLNSRLESASTASSMTPKAKGPIRASAGRRSSQTASRTRR